MKNRFVYLLILLFSIISLSDVKAKKNKIADEFREIAYLHIVGDNFEAIKKLEKLKKKIDKKSDQLFVDQCYWNMMMAKCHAALGQFSKAETFLTTGKSIYKSELPSGGPEEIRVLRYLGQYQMDNQHYLEVESHLNNAMALALKQIPIDTFLISELQLEKLQVRMARGQLSLFQSLYDSLYSYYSSRVVKELNVYNPKKGKNKTIKLKKVDYLTRVSRFVDMKNLKARFFIEKGDYQAADTILANNQRYIKANLSKTTNVFIDHLMNYAMYYDGIGNYSESYSKWDDVINISKRSGDDNYVKDSPALLNAHESMINVLIKDGKFGLAKENIRTFENSLNTVLRYKNIYQNKIDHLKVILAAYDMNWPLAKRDLENIVRDTVTVPKNHPERLKYLETYYKISIKLEEAEKAEKYLNQILITAANSFGVESPVYHRYRLIAADYNLNNSRHNEDSKKEIEESYRLGVKSIWEPNHKDFHRYQKYHLSLLEFSDRNQEALAELDSIREYFFKRQIRNLNFAVELDEMAKFQYNLGYYKEMERNLYHASSIYKDVKKEKSFEYANHMINWSRLYFVSGQFSDAEDAFRDAIKRAQKSEKDNPFETLDRINNELVSLYITIGDYSKAEKMTDEEISYIRDVLTEDSPLLIDPYNNKALLYLLAGEFSEAEAYNQKALKISEKTYGKKSLRHIKSLEIQKHISLDKGDFKRAAEIATEILERRKNLLGEKHLLVASSMTDIAVIRYNMGDDAQSVLAQLNRASQLIKSELDAKSPQYASVLKQKAYLYITEGEIEKAEPLLDSAYTIWLEKVGDKSIEAADLEMLRGDLYLKRKNFKSAEESYEEAMGVYKKVFNDDHPKYVKALSSLSRVYFIKKDFKTCTDYLSLSMEKYLSFIDKFFPTMSEKEKNKYWNLIKGDFEFFNTVAIEVYDENPKLLGDAYGYTLTTKAILLNSTIKVRQTIARSGNQELIEKYNQWITKKETLTESISMNEEELQQNGLDLDKLKDEIEFLEKDLSRLSDVFSSNLSKSQFDWKDVRKNLEDGEAAIEIVKFRKYHESFTDTIIYAALIVTKDSKKSPELVLFENGAEMEQKYYKGYKNRIKFKLSDPVSYTMFWEPIEQKLSGINKVFLSVDGVYNQINVETLQKPDGNFVIDEKSIILLSNTKEIIVKKGRLAIAGKNEAILFGNPQFHASNGTLAPLPGAEKEVNDIYSFLKTKNWECDQKLNEQATEMAVKSIRSPKVFHVATHGFFVPDERTSKERELEELGLKQTFDNTLLKSGLVLDYGGDLLDHETPLNFNKSNGLLTAYEAMNLSLEKTDLVVLSACETGLGDISAGEGVYGLQRSLIVAGARSVIMSLFKVSDEATQQLMLKFYNNWLGGMDKRTAFIEAKREMKKEYKDPIYWGAFVMIGYD